MKKRTLGIAIAIIVLVGSGFYGYTKLTATPEGPRFVLGQARRDTLVVSVSGSGQVSARDKIDLKPKTSGDIVSL
ncbi:MAG: hypothetical protein AAB855_00230, partial [Patescibacteria group bacterium]